MNWLTKLFKDNAVIIIIATSVIFMLVSGGLFCWGRILFNPELPIDEGVFGTIGDFIGGVLGTIFAIVSVWLMYLTFRHQQTVTRESNRQSRESNQLAQQGQKQMTVQRFNDMFFELLHLYQTIVATLSGHAKKIDRYKLPENGKIIEAQAKDVSYNDKDFFDIEMAIMQSNFQPQNSFIKNRSLAKEDYYEFYVKHKMIGAYFRTLYRIYDLIERADIESRLKRDYIKVIRAQLTESELFFIRYNSMTEYGVNFIKYLNKYHVLKHLPPFSLLEFKEWWVKLSPIERVYLNILYFKLRRQVIRMLKGGDNEFSLFQPDKKVRYNIEIKIPNPWGITIKIIRDTNHKTTQREYAGFNKLQAIEIQQMFDCILKEMFVYSNLIKFNFKKFTILSPDIQESNGKEVITSGLSLKSHKSLLDLFPYMKQERNSP